MIELQYRLRVILCVSLLLLPLLCAAQQILEYPIRDFSGGMVTDFDQRDLEQKYGSWVYNVENTKGRLENRKGYVLVNELNLEDSLPNSRPINFYQYAVSSPNLWGTDDGNAGLYSIREHGDITVVHSIHDAPTGTPKYMIEEFRTYPKYTPSASEPDEGTWTDEWSGDYNLSEVAPGRSIALRSAGLRDFVVAENALHISAGASSGAGFGGGTDYTFPWWFGHVGRWFWRGEESLTDDFYIYHSSLFPIDTTNFEVLLGARSTSGEGVPTNALEVDEGRYWIRFALEYDGFQFSAPTADSLFFIDVDTGARLLRVRIKMDSTWLSRRVTALIVFSTDATQLDEPYYYGGSDPDNNLRRGRGREPPPSLTPDIEWDLSPLYFFRKRIAISDADTTNLGWVWKNNTKERHKFTWWENGTNRLDTLYLDADDFSIPRPSMWDWIGHDSNENIILPEHISYIEGQMWAGNVLVDSPFSKVNELFRNRVFQSPYYQPDSYPINNFIDVGANAGSYVTAIKEWNGEALIWTNDAFEVWQPGEFPVRLEQFVRMGCDAPRSVQITPYGIFWANYDGVYHYSGTGIPQPIITLIDTEYDSFAVAKSAKWFGSGNVDILPYAESFYSPKLQLYGVLFDTIRAAGSDTLNLDEDYVWGNINVPRLYGGGGTGGAVLVYNIPYQSWTKWQWDKYFRKIITGIKGEMLGLSHASGLSYDDERVYSMNKGLLDDDAGAEYAWNSGWTDMGYPGRQKDLIGIELDYTIFDSTELEVLYADCVQVDVHIDGREIAWDTFYFMAQDSIGAAKGTGYFRRVHYLKSDSLGTTSDDPSYSLGVLYDFKITAGDGLSYAPGHKMQINSITPRFQLVGLRE